MNLKTPALRFRVDRKQFEDGAFLFSLINAIFHGNLVQKEIALYNKGNTETTLNYISQQGKMWAVTKEA